LFLSSLDFVAFSASSTFLHIKVGELLIQGLINSNVSMK
jgi:hypothetical protein